MANTLLTYDPIWYAQRAIERLDKRLTFVPRMFRQYENEPRQKGSTIKIRKPGGFAAQAMPISTAQDVTPTEVELTLDQWYGDVIAVTDKELAYTGEQFVNEHIDPLMQALAEKIEASCLELYADIPWFVDNNSDAAVGDFISARKKLNELNVPMSDRYFAVNHEREAGYLSLSLFHEADKSSDGSSTQREGTLGRKFGFDTFTVPSLGNHTPGTAITGTVQLVGAHAKGAKTITVDGVTAGTLKKGDTLVIAGSSQRYAVKADVANAASMTITISDPEGLRQAYADNAAVTFRQEARGVNIAAHREAFALVMAPLSDIGNGKGAEIGIAVDDQTGLALRFRRWYEPKEAQLYVGFDALWGKGTLDPNRAVRLESPTV